MSKNEGCYTFQDYLKEAKLTPAPTHDCTAATRPRGAGAASRGVGAVWGWLRVMREARGMTQRDLAEASGLKQPAIARIESHRSVPRVDTLLKLLVPLGYTLKIVPLEGSERL